MFIAWFFPDTTQRVNERAEQKDREREKQKEVNTKRRRDEEDSSSCRPFFTLSL